MNHEGLMTFAQLCESTGLARRAVRGWIARLRIEPQGMDGLAHLYSPAAVYKIQTARRRVGLARRAERLVQKLRRRARILTLKEAKAAARKGVRR